MAKRGRPSNKVLRKRKAARRKYKKTLALLFLALIVVGIIWYFMIGSISSN